MTNSQKKMGQPSFISIAGGKPKQRNFAELEEELIRINHLLYDTQHLTHTAYFEYTPATNETTWSEFIYHMFGLEPFSVEPSDEIFDDLIHPEDLEGFRKMRSQIPLKGVPEGYKFRIIVDQKVKYLNMNAVSEKDEKGNINRIIGATQDITAQTENEYYRHAINHFTRDLINLNSLEDLIKYVAKEVVKELGFEDCVIYLLDKDTDELIQSAAFGQKTDQHQNIIEPISIPIGKGVTGTVAASKTPTIVDDITKHNNYISDIENMGSELCVPILHEGKLLGVIDSEHSSKNFFTLTHMGILSAIASILGTKLSQWYYLEKKRLSEANLINAQKLAHFGNWNMDIKSNVIKWSEEVYRIFGCEPNSFIPSYDTFKGSIHPDDAEFVIEAMQKAIEGEKKYDIDFRIVRPNATLRFVHVIGEVIFNSDKEAVQMIGTVLDITERKTAEDAARASETRLEEVFKLAPESIMTFDQHLNIQLFNRSAENTFGYKKEEIIGKNVSCLIPSQFRDMHTEHIDNFKASDANQIKMDGRQEISGIRKSGEQFPADVSVSKIEINGELFFIAMLRDITKRKQTETALNKALEKATEANKAKSNFLAVMSHELRTPLNAIMGFSEMMMGQIFGKLGSEKYDDYVKDINSSSKHLLELVNSILDLSSIDANSYKLNIERLDLNHAVSECLKIVEGLRTNKNISCNVEIPADIANIYADPKSLKQILLNLLSNSIKYTPNGGEISVRAHTNKTEHIIEISDTGLGIPEKALKYIAEPFTRLENSAYTANEGTGLGLSIVKSLVELHDGELKISSPNQKGTKATINFPFGPDE